jgi:hypothetical protein
MASSDLLKAHIRNKRALEDIKRDIPIALANRYDDGYKTGRADGLARGVFLGIILCLPIYLVIVPLLVWVMR